MGEEAVRTAGSTPAHVLPEGCKFSATFLWAADLPTMCLGSCLVCSGFLPILIPTSAHLEKPAQDGKQQQFVEEAHVPYTLLCQDQAPVGHENMHEAGPGKG